ncbi:GL22942 [Drosophila persimilis]|uniref:GL22942 n=1 Tax=Drosophila persimilis TaxID=7234 RepID=B4HBK3_DROPE|nr:GL22942 [Drosophila persimilis]
MPQGAGITSQHEETLTSQSAAISRMQIEMTELKNMLAQLVTMQMHNAEATASQQQQITEENTQEIFHDNSPGGQAIKNVRQASVKEIANTLPEFDPSDDNAISVNQFIDRVNKVVDAYQLDEKFVLLGSRQNVVRLFAGSTHHVEQLRCSHTRRV